MPVRAVLRRLLPRHSRIRTILLSLFCLCIAASLPIAYFLLFHVALPIRRAYYLETAYLRAINFADFSDDLVSGLANVANATVVPHSRRIHHLIEDVEQLHYCSYDGSRRYHESLGLNRDGTGSANARGREYWIYIGGRLHMGLRRAMSHPKIQWGVILGTSHTGIKPTRV